MFVCDCVGLRRPASCARGVALRLMGPLKTNENAWSTHVAARAVLECERDPTGGLRAFYLTTEHVCVREE